jgi:hypothetical protein
MWRLLGQLCAFNWAKGDLYSRLLGHTELPCSCSRAYQPNGNSDYLWSRIDVHITLAQGARR